VVAVAAVGTPEITPVEVFKDKPVGSAPPAVIEYVTAPTKFVAVKEAVVNCVPTLPTTVSLFTLNEAIGVDTVNDKVLVAVWPAADPVIV
jgi:hypothetical protein